MTQNPVLTRIDLLIRKSGVASMTSGSIIFLAGVLCIAYLPRVFSNASVQSVLPVPIQESCGVMNGTVTICGEDCATKLIMLIKRVI